jgi:opacity protein-like surface antigen
MKKVKIIIVVMAIFCFTLPASAQKALKLDVNYNYSIPLSGFKSDLVSNGSPRGFKAGLMYSFTDRLDGGLSFGFQDYYQKYPRTIYKLSETQQISAVLSNSIQTTPVILKAKYFLTPNTFVKPYISLGAGANVVDFKQYFGEFPSSQTNVGFLAEGGVGVMIPFKKTASSGINIGSTYDYAPYKKNGYKDLNSVNFQAGVVIEVR